MLITDKKNKLRSFFKVVRGSIPLNQKKCLDSKIMTRLINSDIYRRSDLILVYASFGSEISTYDIIDYSLEIGKRVCIPYCSGKEMLFYEIFSSSNLSAGKYGILSVDPTNNLPVECFENALCIVPGLCFDLLGNRLGYGGGFYDRFLVKNNIATIGLTYEICICSHIPIEKTDVTIDAVITENYYINCERGGFCI